MLQAQKSAAAEVQQVLKHIQKQSDEQRELLELALSTSRAGNRQEPRGLDGPSHTSGAPFGTGHEEQQLPDRSYQYRAPRGRCFRCNGVGHFARNCPGNNLPDGRHMDIQPASTTDSAGGPNGTTQNRRIAPITTAYLQVNIGGCQNWVLFDTGSEISIIPSSCITDEEILPNCQKLIAANGTEIDVQGEADVDLEFDTGLVIRSKFLVSSHVDEVMLGLDWLRNQRCIWNFNDCTIRINGNDFKLCSSKANLRVRRVVLQDDTTIPPSTQKVVKAKTIYGRLKFDRTIWATEAGEITPGVKSSSNIGQGRS